jgi:hypothetical protein
VMDKLHRKKTELRSIYMQSYLEWWPAEYTSTHAGTFVRFGLPAGSDPRA